MHRRNPLALARPFSVDPLADTYSPVASDAITWGEYYTGLTRDDVAGLRYLLRTNNVNYESLPAGTAWMLTTTNKLAPESFPPYNAATTSGTNTTGFYYFTGNTNGGYGYGDLAALISFARTNGPTALQAAYPGVVIASYTNNLVWSSNETYFYYTTNTGYG